jgi:hypothetical protein
MKRRGRDDLFGFRLEMSDPPERFGQGATLEFPLRGIVQMLKLTPPTLAIVGTNRFHSQRRKRQDFSNVSPYPILLSFDNLDLALLSGKCPRDKIDHSLIPGDSIALG